MRRSKGSTMIALWAALCLALCVGVSNGQTCNTQVDLVLVLDGSQGLTEAEFNNLRQLTIDYINAKDASPTSELHAGVVVVGNGIELRTPVDNDHATLENTLNAFTFPAASEQTMSTAIEVGFNDLVVKASPTGTPKVMIVFTAQESQQPTGTAFSADFARRVGIVTYAVALKNVPTGATSEAVAIAGDASRVRTLQFPGTATALPDIDLDLLGVDCGNTVTTPAPTAPPTTPTPILAVPQIILSPTSDFQQSGNFLAVRCVTTDSGTITYRFLRNNVIVDEGDDTFIITSSTTADSGSYQCVAIVNGRASSPSNAQSITIIDKPTTPTLLTSNSNPIIGDLVTLTCSSATVGVTNYEFLRSGITQTTSANSQFTVSSSTAGSYTCRVYVQTIVSDSSNQIFVSFTDPTPSQPTLTTTSNNPNDGQTTVLTCSSVSAGITAYEFRRNGIQVQLSAGSTLTLSSQAQDGSYTCVAYINAQQSLVSNAQTITFFVQPVTPTTPTLTTSTNNAVDGQSVFLSCNTADNGVTLYEFRRGSVVLQSSSLSTYTISNGVINTIDNQYTCVSYIGNVVSSSSNAQTVSFRPASPQIAVTSTTAQQEGQTITLTCGSSTQNVATYEFRRGATSISFSPTGTYSIFNAVKSRDDGVYTCVAYVNTVASDTSFNSVTLNLALAPTQPPTTQPPVNQPAQPVISASDNNPADGTIVTLTCASSTIGITSYEFKQAGQSLQTSASATYTVTAGVITANAALNTYTCVAYINQVASVESTGVIVAYRPADTTITLSGSRQEGDPFTLSCTTTSSPVTTYQFLRGSTTLIFATASTYTVPSGVRGRDDVSQFSCVAYVNNVPSLSANGVTLQFVDNPVTNPPVTVAPQPATPVLTTTSNNAVDGTFITLSCSTSTIGATSIEFRRDGVVVRTVNGNAAQLSVNTAVNGQTNQYTCVAYNGQTVSAVSNSQFITFTAPVTNPPVTVAPQPNTPVLTTTSNNAVDGTIITLSCSTTTFGASSIEFRRDGVVVGTFNGNSAQFSVSTAVNGQTNQYTCVAYNGQTVSAVSNSQFITFTAPVTAAPQPNTPTLVASSNSQIDGNIVTLTCSSTSPSVTSIEFRRDGSVVRTFNNNNAQLTISSAVGGQANSYTCLAYNGQTASFASFPQVVTFRPATPVLQVSGNLQEGSDFVITCTTTTQGITSWRFSRDNVNLAFTSRNSLTVSSAQKPQDEGVYSCAAFSGSIVSDQAFSTRVTLSARPTSGPVTNPPTTRQPVTQPTVRTTRGPVGPTTRGPVGPTTRGPVGPTTRGPINPTNPTNPPTTRGPVTRPTEPATLRPLQAGSLCEGARVLLGVGYGGVPGSPESFFQCYFPPTQSGRKKRDLNDRIESVSMGVTGSLVVVRQCPFGSFWNQGNTQCVPAGECPTSTRDDCADENMRSRAAVNNCRGFYACINGRSVPKCCPPGQTYTKLGCLSCSTCDDFCTGTQVNRGNWVNMMQVTQATECYYQPAWDDPTAYEVRKGGSISRQQCPDGEIFSVSSCMCVSSPWRNDTEPVCSPGLDVPNFFLPGPRVSTSDVVVTAQGEALLQGDNSVISVNLDDGNTDFANYAGPVVMQFRYKEINELTSRQVLLASPADCDKAGLIYLTVDRESLLLEISSESGKLTSLRLPTAGFKPDELKTVRVVDNNDFISLMVTDGVDAYITRTRAPAAPYIQCGLDIGNHKYQSGFKGVIDGFTFYQCVPDNVAA